MPTGGSKLQTGWLVMFMTKYKTVIGEDKAGELGRGQVTNTMFWNLDFILQAVHLHVIRPTTPPITFINSHQMILMVFLSKDNISALLSNANER